jgi:RHS repeat-associated protein
MRILVRESERHDVTRHRMRACQCGTSMIMVAREPRRQIFDAFGVNIDGYITFQCLSGHDYNSKIRRGGDMPWHQDCSYWACWPWKLDAWGDPYPCFTRYGQPLPYTQPDCPIPPERQAHPVERMQTGSFNWRGGEGSITDRVTQDMQDSETGEMRWSAYTRPSTGLIYMGARYYEPETGRFTQPDPVPYGVEMAWGQNNRWVYCANDSVNASDPTGMFFPWIFVGLFVTFIGIGLFLGGAVSGNTTMEAIGALLTTIGPAIAAGPAFWAAALAEAKDVLLLVLILMRQFFGVMWTSTCSPSASNNVRGIMDILLDMARLLGCADKGEGEHNAPPKAEEQRYARLVPRFEWPPALGARGVAA